jgi:hypothetical protein
MCARSRGVVATLCQPPASLHVGADTVCNIRQFGAWARDLEM